MFKRMLTSGLLTSQHASGKFFHAKVPRLLGHKRRTEERTHLKTTDSSKEEAVQGYSDSSIRRYGTKNKRRQKKGITDTVGKTLILLSEGSEFGSNFLSLQPIHETRIIPLDTGA